MDDGPPQYGVAIFNAVQLFVFYAILGYSVHQIIRHRHAPHIANVSSEITCVKASVQNSGPVYVYTHLTPYCSYAMCSATSTSC